MRIMNLASRSVSMRSAAADASSKTQFSTLAELKEHIDESSETFFKVKVNGHFDKGRIEKFLGVSVSQCSQIMKAGKPKHTIFVFTK